MSVIRPDGLQIVDIAIDFNFLKYSKLEIDLHHINRGKKLTRYTNFSTEEILKIVKAILNYEVLESSTQKDYGDDMKNNSPYEIDVGLIKPSKKVTDERELLKYRLSAEINKILDRLTTEQAVNKTGLNRADLSRIKIQSISRFSIDRLIKILILLDQSVSITVKTKKAAS